MCRSTHYLWIYITMHHVWLIWFPWQPQIWLILWKTCKNVKTRDTPSPISRIWIINRQIWYMYVGLYNLSLKNSNVNLYLAKMVNFMGNIYKNVPPISIIMIQESQIWYVWVGLQLLSVFLTLAFYNTQILHWLNDILNMFVFVVMINVVVAISLCKNVAGPAALTFLEGGGGGC